MCIAFPGRVIELDPAGAIVETEGRRRRASTLLLPDIAPGDWVTVAAGAIVGRLEPAEAAEIQRLLTEAIELERASSRPGPAVASPASDANPPEGAPDVQPG